MIRPAQQVWIYGEPAWLCTLCGTMKCCATKRVGVNDFVQSLQAVESLPMSIAEARLVVVVKGNRSRLCK